MNICATDFPAGMSEVEDGRLHHRAVAEDQVPRIAEAHAALECREYTTMEIGRSRIILGRVVAMYVEDRYVDPDGPYIKADELHSIGRMNGLGNYVRTRDAFITHPAHLV
jgi:flavin reductase (DIM6/NTAB) family NADH-FMN oxidoreductase RutF